MRLREFSPSRTQFSRILSDTDLRMGFECEVYIREASGDYDNDEPPEVDWDAVNRRINSMSWYELSNYVSGRTEARIDRDYEEWITAKMEKDWEEHGPKIVAEYRTEHTQGDLFNPSEAPDDDDMEDAAKDAWLEGDSFEDVPDRKQYLEDYDMDAYIEEDYSSVSRFCRDYDIDIEPDDDEYQEQERGNNTEYVHSEAASSLRRAVGAHVYVGSGGPEDWHVEEDGSLSGDEVTGMEIVSPVFEMKEGLEQLKTVFEWIDDYDAYTDSDTGLHVSFSIVDKKLEDYDYFKMIILFDENYTADLFDRIGNIYASQMRGDLAAKMNNVTDVSQLSERSIDAMVATLRQMSPKLHSIASKYFSFRHRAKGVFEFRSMGGDDYHHQYDTIRKRIVAMAAVMKVGSDPHMMAKEYVSRVWRMLTTDKYDSPETVSNPRAKPVQPHGLLTTFTQLFARDPRLAQAANSEPAKFIMGLAAVPTPLTKQQIRQLRIYAKKHGLSAHSFTNWQDRDPAHYNVMANYLRWPMIVPTHAGQGTLPFARPGAPPIERPDTPEYQGADRNAYRQPSLPGLRSY